MFNRLRNIWREGTLLSGRVPVRESTIHAFSAAAPAAESLASRPKAISRDLLDQLETGLNDDRSRFLALWRLTADVVAQKSGWPRYPRFPKDKEAKRLDRGLWLRLERSCRDILTAGDPAFLGLEIQPTSWFFSDLDSNHDDSRSLWTRFALLDDIAQKTLEPVLNAFGPVALLFPCLRNIPQFDSELIKTGITVPHFGKQSLFYASLPWRWVALIPQSRADLAQECVKSGLEAWSSLLDAALAKASGSLRSVDRRVLADHFLNIETLVLPWSQCPESVVKEWAGSEWSSSVPEDDAEDALYSGRLSILSELLDSSRTNPRPLFWTSAPNLSIQDGAGLMGHVEEVFRIQTNQKWENISDFGALTRQTELSETAILFFDVDRVGHLLASRSGPTLAMVYDPNSAKARKRDRRSEELVRPLGQEEHAALCEAQTDFAVLFAPLVVKQHSGVLLQSSPEHVVAILPSKNAISCACDLAQLWRENFALDSQGISRKLGGDRAETSVGVAFLNKEISHMAGLKLAQAVCRKAKEEGGNALGLMGNLSSTLAPSVLLSWDTADKLRIFVDKFPAFHDQTSNTYISADGQTHLSHDLDFGSLSQLTWSMAMAELERCWGHGAVEVAASHRSWLSSTPNALTADPSRFDAWAFAQAAALLQTVEKAARNSWLANRRMRP